ALFDADGAAAHATIGARADALREYYVFLDRLLREVVSPAADDLVVLVTEPGRVNARAPGLLGISGSAARRGTEITGRAADVAPTVLHALGVPISRALAGAPLRGLFSEAYLERYPVRQVARYGRPSALASVRTGQPLDQEMIDRLRSLGYVR